MYFTFIAGFTTSCISEKAKDSQSDKSNIVFILIDDLEADTGEKTNLAETHPEKAGELMELLERWRKETHVQMPLIRDN